MSQWAEFRNSVASRLASFFVNVLFLLFQRYSAQSHLWDNCNLLLHRGEGERHKLVSSRVSGAEQALQDAQVLRRVSLMCKSNLLAFCFVFKLTSHRYQARHLALPRRGRPLLHVHVHPHNRRRHQIQAKEHDRCVLVLKEPFWSWWLKSTHYMCNTICKKLLFFICLPTSGNLWVRLGEGPWVRPPQAFSSRGRRTWVGSKLYYKFNFTRSHSDLAIAWHFQTQHLFIQNLFNNI